jgi:MOSC domain-containing protein YiiM
MMAGLLSVNIGRPEPIASKSGMTGIFKRSAKGPVAIGRLGLEGDTIMDRKHHGGPDQAVYIYFADDYDWWNGELAAEMVPGTFGENLTIAGVEGRNVSVGDRFAIGKVLLEVTAHRTPCATLAARMGDPRFLKRFHRARRPGGYCRVLQAGSVTAGDLIGHNALPGSR